MTEQQQQQREVSILGFPTQRPHELRVAFDRAGRATWRAVGCPYADETEAVVVCTILQLAPGCTTRPCEDDLNYASHFIEHAHPVPGTCALPEYIDAGAEDGFLFVREFEIGPFTGVHKFVMRWAGDIIELHPVHAHLYHVGWYDGSTWNRLDFARYDDAEFWLEYIARKADSRAYMVVGQDVWETRRGYPE